MQYLGGKSRIAKRIAPFLIADGVRCHTYLEPFIGGGSVFAEVSPYFEKAIGADMVPDLVMLWQALLEGWEPPSKLTREEWTELRHSEPSALRAFAGYGLSFGGKWFAGFAEDNPAKHQWRAGAAARGLLKKVSRFNENSLFECASYDTWAPDEETLVYCDPPYAGATQYGATGRFDSAKFWRVAESWADSGATVFVSEYEAPPHWSEVWAAPVRATLHRTGPHRTAVERLFTL